jgi:hypothetical protein
MRRLAAIALSCALAACGSIINGGGNVDEGGDAGGSGEGGAGGLGLDGASLAEVGSLECPIENDSGALPTNRPCRLCSDKEWHCGTVGGIYAPCPIDIVNHGPCDQSEAEDRFACLSCANGKASTYLCRGAGSSGFTYPFWQGLDQNPPFGAACMP